MKQTLMRRRGAGGIGKRRLGAAVVGITIVGLVASSAAANADNPSYTPLELNNPAQLQVESAGQFAGSTVSAPLTLITGDQLHVGLDADGEPVVTRTTPAPRDHGGAVVFYKLTRHGQAYVVPDDALPLLHDGVLDWELFNPAALVALALDGTVGEVPVIVRHNDGVAGAATFDGATETASLTSIDATVTTIAGDGVWWQQVQADAAPGARATSRGPLAGVEKVWLNGVAQIHLHESVPQIGSEVAWSAGYDGSGVTVAVLDTGIDPDHPDVAGKIVDAVDFTGSATGTADGHGHGTHVAATVLGSGDASEGLRPGVAPGADLLVGKVCNDGGSCPNDAIIAGMEWAAESGAEVVNMSLGAGPTDGTDPLSMAVNQLSQQHGTLFVISAGNSGPGASSVSSPSTADEALSVAAIDKLDEMADFSSRGPRVGDGGFKPEIAAPGVDIVAARSAGTAMGTVVDDYYTTASGTSMSAPHVAGAAAAVAEAHPDMSGSEIKGLLMSTAVDLGHDPDAQGMGRVDVGNAVDPSVFVEGSLAFGREAYPHSPIIRTVTYTNVTDDDITLSLATSLTTSDGSEAPTGLLSADADEITVPANESRQVQVTLDGSVLGEDDAYGGFRGRLSATDEDGQLRATSMVSAVLEPEAHEVTIEIIAPDGAQDVTYQQLVVSPMGTETILYDDWITLPGGEQAQTDLFAGVYTIAGDVRWRDADGVQHVALPMELELTVTGPASVTLDLRDAQQVEVQVPEQTDGYYADVTLARSSPGGEWLVEGAFAAAEVDDGGWWVLPTEPVTTGSFTYSANFALSSPLVELRAIGGGQPIDLQARYGTQDSSVPGVTHVWQVGEEQSESQVYDHRVPRLDRRVPTQVIDGGTGSAADLAEVDVRGRLLFIQPTDICGTDCDFTELHERVAAAGDAGAVAVAVAGDSGRVTLPNPPSGQVECEQGPGSCPPVEGFANLPVVSVPAAAAAQLRERLQGPAPVRIQTGGTSQLERIYALGFGTDGQVPGDLPHQVDRDDLYSVEHRIHSHQPGEVTQFGFARLSLAPDAAPTESIGLPRTPSQRSVEMLVGPHRDDVIDSFEVRVDEWVGPQELAQYDIQDRAMSITPTEQQTIELTDGEVLSWNVGISVPGAFPNVPRASGEEEALVATAPCAGCREGDRFWPTMYVTSSAGNPSELIGMTNDTGLSAFLLGMATCQEPYCSLNMADGSGDQLEQTLLPVEMVIGERPANTAPDEFASLLPTDHPVFGGVNVNLERKEGQR